jgi:hypothetical protein
MDRISCANCGAAAPFSEGNICCTDQNKMFYNIRSSWDASYCINKLYESSLEVGKIIVNRGVAEIHFDELLKFFEFAFNSQRDQEYWEKKEEVRLFRLHSGKIDRFIALVDNVVAVFDVVEEATPIIRAWGEREDKHREQERQEMAEARDKKQAEEQQRLLKLKEEEELKRAIEETKRIDYESKMKEWQCLSWNIRRKTPKPMLEN